MASISRDASIPSSRWRRLDARFRLPIVVAAIIAGVTLPPSLAPVAHNWPVSWIQVACALTAVILLAIERAPLRNLLAPGVAIFGSILLFGAAIPFVRPANEAAFYFAAIFSRGVVSWLWISLLISTTNPEEMLRSLSKLRLPAIFLSTLVSMNQYLEIMLDESRRMRRAREARSFETTRRFSLRQWRASANILGVLFLRAHDRAEKLHRAMLARGYDGETRFLS